MIGKCLSSDVITSFLSRMASNLRQARTQAGGRQTFIQYVFCPKCHSVYPKKQSILIDQKGNISNAFCSHVRFLAHPQHCK